MATQLGDRVTDVYRAQQIQAVRPLIGAVRRYTPAIVPERPATYGAYADLIVPLVGRTRAQTQALAWRYYRQMAALETPGRSLLSTPPPPEEADYEQRMRRSIDYLAGNRYPKRLDSGVSPARAEQQLQVDLAGMAIRNALEPGREQVRAAVRADRVATGYVRVTAMDAFVCWFCAMLASRTDYKEGSFDKSDPRFKLGGNPLANAKVHDHCRCMLRPIFDHEPPERNRWLEEKWYELTEGADDLAKAWRQGWEALLASGNVPWLGATG